MARAPLLFLFTCLSIYLILSILFCSVLFYFTLFYSFYSLRFSSPIQDRCILPAYSAHGAIQTEAKPCKILPAVVAVSGDRLRQQSPQQPPAETHLCRFTGFGRIPGRLPPPNLSRSGGPIAILTQRCCSLGRSAVEAADKGIGKWAWFHPGARPLYQYAGSAETVQSFPYACTIKQINSWRGWLCNDISPKFRGFANFLEK